MDTDKSNIYKIGALNKLDNWKLKADEKDIRGMDLYTIHDDHIGEIKHLIADTETKKIRYAEVKLDERINQYRDYSYRDQMDKAIRSHFGKEDYYHVLIPIGMMKVDTSVNKVIASPNLTVEYISSAPRYQGISRESATPIHEWMAVKYFADLDQKDRKVYNEKKYDFEGYRTTPYITDNEFYGSDLFSRDRYLSRYQDRSTTMAGVDTGAIR